MANQDSNSAKRERDSRRVVVPSRRMQDKPIAPIKDIPTFARPPASQPKPTPVLPKDPSTKPQDLAAVRQKLGFDDIPISTSSDATDSKGYRKLFFVYNFLKDKEFLHWKDDLKWALKADSTDDEPSKAPPVRQSPQPKTPPPQHAQPKTIDINISLGSLPSPSKYLKRIKFAAIKNKIVALRSNRRALIIVGIIVIIICLFILPQLITKRSESNPGKITSTHIDEKPNYATILPSGKNIADLGGWKRVSPPERDPVFAYVDKINGTPINVSQQPLPSSFKPDTDSKIADLAKSFSATDKVSAGDMAIYIGTSAKGPQSVIFTKNNLLILIKSTVKIDDKDWATYIESLN